MKRFVIFITIFLFFACGVKENPPTYVLPDPSKLIERGWEEYQKGNFQTAYVLFDSALILNPFIAEGYHGKGWSALALQNYPASLSAFSFTNIVKNVSMEGFASEKISGDDTSHIKIIDPTKVEWILIPYTLPIVGYSKISLFKVKDKKYISLEPRHFSDTAFEFISSDYPTFDTLFVDTVYLQYYYFKNPDSLPNICLYASSGIVGASFAFSDYFTALKVGKEIVLTGKDFNFPYYPNTNLKDVKILMAYAAFKVKLYKVCVEILQELDPEWTPPPDPFNPEAWNEILKELEKLMGG